MSPVCFHCGDTVPPGLQLSASIDGAERPMCCLGCKSVAEFIASSGLQTFYRHREEPLPGTPVASTDDSWDRFDGEHIQERYLGSDGRYSDVSIEIGGMYCSACAWLLNAVLQNLPGVQSVSVNATSRRAVVRFEREQVSLGKLLEAIARIGFNPAPVSLDLRESATGTEYHAALKRLIVAGAAGMQVMMFAIALYFGDHFGIDVDVARFLKLVSLLVTVPIVFYAARPFFSGALRSIRARAPGMDVPVSIAISSAFAASLYTTWIDNGPVYFDSVAMFVFFLSASRFLEMRAQHRSEDQATAFAALLPDTVLQVSADGDQWVAPGQLTEGDRIRVRQGDVVSVDGLIDHGAIAVDESVLTGESMAMERTAGAEVRAGSVICSGSAVITATQTGMRTSLAEIGRMLDRAKSDRPPVALLADRIAARFVIAVLILTAAAGGMWAYIDPARAFEVALATLVVTCPCALALATPAALAAATSRLARAGFLLVRSRVLDVLNDRPTIVFDKTGTLTEGRPSLAATTIMAGGTESKAHYVSLAAAIEATSEHVLARAFAPYNEPGRHEISAVMIVAGAGVSATVNGIEYRLGKWEFVCDENADDRPADHPTSNTQVYLSSQAQVLARFDIRDKLRRDARDTIASLIRRGYRIVIASGDRAGAVENVAGLLGIGHWYAELTPAGKLNLIRDLRNCGDKILMVGDGINDAPVLAAADASVALDAGTALARASADAVSLGERLGNILTACDIARAARKVIRQNLAWAIAYNLVAVPLAVSGQLAPWMAAAGMSASSLLVVLNALRLNSMRLSPSQTPGTRESVNVVDIAYE